MSFLLAWEHKKKRFSILILGIETTNKSTFDFKLGIHICSKYLFPFEELKAVALLWSSIVSISIKRCPSLTSDLKDFLDSRINEETASLLTHESCPKVGGACKDGLLILNFKSRDFRSLYSYANDHDSIRRVNIA